ncbi:hypothetical protein DVH24_001270 [Malus domestica]|uniref:Uncharacterized protein n=1 Tax=Malus domestica TaxID=3750 RepID=A0A498K0R3_MALDO|nr:hypothetical protein DVH24_001270 [Malus domestica]
MSQSFAPSYQENTDSFLWRTCCSLRRLFRLLYELLKKLDSELKYEVCHWAVYYVVYMVTISAYNELPFVVMQMTINIPRPQNLCLAC